MGAGSSCFSTLPLEARNPIVRYRSPIAGLVTAALTPLVMAGTANAAAFHLDVHFVSTPAKISNQASPVFTIARNVHYKIRDERCRVDAGAWKPCGTPWRPGRLADGTHTVQVMLRAGGQTATARYTWQIDTVKPSQPVVTGAAEGWQVLSAASASAAGSADTGSGLAGYQLRTATTGGWSAPAAGDSYTATTQGITTIEFRAVDRAGNTSAWVGGQIELDDTAPMLGQAPVTQASYPTDFTIDVPSVSDPESGVAGIEYRWYCGECGAWSGANPATGSTVPFSMMDGWYTVQFRAVDNAGNVSAWGDDVTFDVSAAGPG